MAIAADASGNIYVADQYNDLIRKITPGGLVSTFAGSAGVTGSMNGTTALFNNPSGVAVDASGNVYVTDSGNGLVREITPGGVVSTFADGFNIPWAIALDDAGNVYVADACNRLIFKITSDKTRTTLAAGYFWGIAVDHSGNVYATNTLNCLIDKITPEGVVTTLAGSGSQGDVNGTGTAASFDYPGGVALDSSGNLYVGDTSNELIRKITSDGIVTTIAGSAGNYGSSNWNGTSALFNDPEGITLDSSGNIYVADENNELIRKITP